MFGVTITACCAAASSEEIRPAPWASPWINRKRNACISALLIRCIGTRTYLNHRRNPQATLMPNVSLYFQYVVYLRFSGGESSLVSRLRALWTPAAPVPTCGFLPFETSPDSSSTWYFRTTAAFASSRFETFPGFPFVLPASLSLSR